MKPIDDEKTISTNLELESRLKAEREQWNKDIISLIKSIDTTSKLSMAQVTQLSYRQIIQDKLVEYRILLERRTANFDKLCQSRAKEYATGSELKLTNSERHSFAEIDHSAAKLQVKMLESQIKYLEECVKTLDNLGYAIKNKIEILTQQLF